jgi:hypothetical protein
LAGADITADVTGGITVVTGVDGADIVEEDLPKMKLLLFNNFNYFSDDIFMKIDVKGGRIIRKTNLGFEFALLFVTIKFVSFAIKVLIIVTFSSRTNCNAVAKLT